VGAAQICGVDAAEMLSGGGAQPSGIHQVRIPTKPAGYSRAKSAMHSNLIAATLPI